MYVQVVRFAAKVRYTHYTPPCSRAVLTGREHGCHFGYPCTRAVETGSYWQWRHNCMHFLLENVWDNTGYQPGPWTRVMCTEPKRNSQINCYLDSRLTWVAAYNLWALYLGAACWKCHYYFCLLSRRLYFHTSRQTHTNIYHRYTIFILSNYVEQQLIFACVWHFTPYSPIKADLQPL